MNDITETLDEWLEAKFREYYPDTKSFFVGADDNDCLTLNANDHGMTFTQTEENMGDGDAEWFEFRSDATGRILTIPFAPEQSKSDEDLGDDPLGEWHGRNE